MGIPISIKTLLEGSAVELPFDDRPNHGADLDDLNVTLIKEYLKEIGSSLYETADTMPFDDLCLSMNIAVGPAEYIKPKNVGLLFFTPDPARFFPCTQIDVVEFPDGLGGERIVESTFTGPADVPGTRWASPGRSGAGSPSEADRLLAYFADNPTATIARAAHDLGVSTSTVSRAISALKLEGRLVREGSARSGRWAVR